MVRKLLTLALVTGSLAVAGCNTLRGVGQDVQSVPDCVQGRTC
ncbi:MAG TPA: entericidin EcnA/B family protein [Allosphingosinicella sp.]|jgi:predicted small secreted protein